jgi:protein-S-isoprenylcysteine O-methyltransferase Ste14
MTINKTWANIVIVATTLVGGVSLVGFLIFLFAGPYGWINLGLSTHEALLFDGLLCFAFFIQHSVMIRRSFRRHLSAAVPTIYHGAVYTLASGIVLLALLVLWQEAGPVLLSLSGAPRMLTRAVFLAGLIGFAWGASSLRGFDTFGLRPIRAQLRGSRVSNNPLSIRGPYRWVRHPLYFFMLVLIWSHPDVTAGRLLFNVSWTCWVFLGTWLEERDLVAEFGQPYKDFQKNVPMLVPWKGPADPL